MANLWRFYAKDNPRRHNRVIRRGVCEAGSCVDWVRGGGGDERVLKEK